MQLEKFGQRLFDSDQTKGQTNMETHREPNMTEKWNCTQYLNGFDQTVYQTPRSEACDYSLHMTKKPERVLLFQRKPDWMQKMTNGWWEPASREEVCALECSKSSWGEKLGEEKSKRPINSVLGAESFRPPHLTPAPLRAQPGPKSDHLYITGSYHQILQPQPTSWSFCILAKKSF